MKTPPIVAPEEWRAAREQLLVKEKELARARDALAAERRRMPWLAVDKEYWFEGPAGRVSLAGLFEGRRQLIVYRAFYGPEVTTYAEGGSYPERACVGCSFGADQVAHPGHLHARNTSLAFASRAPQAEIRRLKERHGWDHIPWYTLTDDFDKDFGVDEWHGTNAFIREGDRIFRTYFIDNRGDEQMGNTWNYLDITALGRQETWEDSPEGYPQTPPYQWWNYHDAHDAAKPRLFFARGEVAAGGQTDSPAGQGGLMSIGTYARFQGTPPHESEGSASTWWNRAANMIIAYSEIISGSVLHRADNADEYFLWTLFTPCRVTAGGRTVSVPAGSVVIIPPVESSVLFAGTGAVWRGFTSLNDDLLEKAPYSRQYAEQPSGVAPVEAWPMPPDGYKIRVYHLDDTPAGKPHCYVHRTSMTNLAWPVATSPRPTDAMSPHTHDDFEQVSIIHSGTMVHHMRRAWSRNLQEWLPDEHEILTAPAVVISKPPDIHTTQAVTAGERVGLIDFFAPVRWDFSNIDGMVVNRAEYPMLPQQPKSHAAAAMVYAASDPRAALNRHQK